nr:NlpC/P60 family protein [Amycolatopsis saalfeldensis]
MLSRRRECSTSSSSTEHIASRRREQLAALKPADLVFYSPGTIHHVGIYLGNGQIINAYESGTVVRTQPINLNEYAGAVRLLQ